MKNEWKMRARERGAFQKINNKGMLSSILKKIPAKVSDKVTGMITDICSLERG